MISEQEWSRAMDRLSARADVVTPDDSDLDRSLELAQLMHGVAMSGFKLAEARLIEVDRPYQRIKRAVTVREYRALHAPEPDPQLVLW